MPRRGLPMTGDRVDLKSLDRDQLKDFMTGMGKEHYRAEQVFKWAWQKGGVKGFDEMTNIAKATRAELAEKAYLSFLEPTAELHSEDGTIKYLWRCEDGSHIESVLIPDEDGPARPRLTLCISTQVGCAMKCSFCLTGDLGLKRNLLPSEITNQQV